MFPESCWEQSSCRVETRKGGGREKYRGSEEDRSSGTGLESSISRPLHTDYYPRSENRFARRVIVAIWSTTSGRHDTKISIKLLAREDRISPSFATEAPFFLFLFVSPITISDVLTSKLEFFRGKINLHFKAVYFQVTRELIYIYPCFFAQLFIIRSNRVI